MSSFTVIKCSRPDVDSATTYYDEEDEDFSYGTQIKYKCHPGFTIFYNSIVTCTDQGYWYPTPPVCTGNR